MVKTKTITPKQIKTMNRQLIYSYVYREKKVSQQEIAYALGLSRPTVTTNLSQLEEEGMIFKNGQIESELIGRKAAAYSIVDNYRIAIGVEITDRQVKIMAINLYGQKIERRVLDIPFENTEDYIRHVCTYINEQIEAHEILKEQILGIGFAVQGLVSPDGSRIVYGEIQKNTGLEIEAFKKYLDYPCTFIHDAESAAICELWESPEIRNAVFILLSNHLGATLIYDGKVNTGMHGHSATIEHLSYVPNGKKCYCGKQGCLETVLSLSGLLEGEEEDEFFEKLQAGDTAYEERWRYFLSILAEAIGDLHLICDELFILSGYLAAHLTEADIRFIYEAIAKTTPFEESSDFIRICKMPKHSITIGAALPYVSAFLSKVME